LRQVGAGGGERIAVGEDEVDEFAFPNAAGVLLVFQEEGVVGCVEPQNV
jgi:hypothetical protein